MTSGSEALVRRVRAALVERCGVNAGSRGIIGLSGGPDSLFLTSVLAELATPMGLRLVAVVVDHGLRPEARAEARRAAALATQLGVSTEVASLADSPSGNVQNWARKQRLAALEAAGLRHEARWIALAHNVEDQAETVLLRIVRGCGPKGLSAMPWVRSLASASLVRPLLGIERREIEHYLADRELTPIVDPTNSSDCYRRNRLRQKVLPLLNEENPRVVDALARLAASCAEEHAALEQMALQAEVSARTSCGSGWAASALSKLPTGLLHRTLQRAYGTFSTASLSRSQLGALASLVSRQEGTAKRSVPGGLAVRRYDVLTFEQGDPDSPGPSFGHRQLTIGEVPATVDWNAAEVLEVRQIRAGKDADDPLLVRLSAVDFPLTIRSPQPGDRITIGPRQRKKVMRALIDEKVPRDQRINTPLVVSADGQIMLALGIRRAYGTRPDVGEDALQFLLRPRTRE